MSKRAEAEAAKQLQERIVAEDKDIDTLRDEVRDAAVMRGGVPVTYTGGEGKTHLRGHNARVVHGASPHEIENYARPPSRTCGSCKFFNLHQGRREIVKQRFAERLVIDEQWKLQHLGAPMDHMGICDQSQGQMVTSTISNADKCEGYRPRSRTMDRR